MYILFIRVSPLFQYFWCNMYSTVMNQQHTKICFEYRGQQAMHVYCSCYYTLIQQSQLHHIRASECYAIILNIVQILILAT